MGFGLDGKPASPRPADEWLAQLRRASPEEALTLAPHVYDIVSQLLDRHIREHDLWDQARSLRSGSLSAKRRVFRAHGEEDVARCLKTLEGASRTVRHGAGSADEFGAFCDAARELIERLGVQTESVRSHAPVGLRVVNAVSVDTQHGYRTVQLTHAHVADVRSDVLALSSNTKADAPAGFIVSFLKHRYGFVSRFDQPFLHFAPTEWTCIQTGQNETPFQTLLTLRLGGPGQGETLEAYMDRALGGLYASLAAMESLGLPTESIAMPVLQAHRISADDEYQLLVGLLVRHAVWWLKRARDTRTINLCVYFGDELAVWTEAMDKALGRTLVAAGQDAAVESLIRELTHLSGQHREGPLSSAVQPLLETLSRPDRVGVEQVGVEGRKLVEVMLSELLRRNDKPVKFELMKNIETARRAGIAAPWVAAYMHTLRIFGNEGVHARLAERVYVPDRLGVADLVTALAAIRALLLYWEHVMTSKEPAAGSQ